MKKFNYEWNGEIFLLHIQVNSESNLSNKISIIRNYGEGGEKIENKNIEFVNFSHRFIISRTHPKEKSVSIEYPDDLIIEAFIVDDRAYYPTESFYKM